MPGDMAVNTQRSVKDSNMKNKPEVDLLRVTDDNEYVIQYAEEVQRYVMRKL